MRMIGSNKNTWEDVIFLSKIAGANLHFYWKINTKIGFFWWILQQFLGHLFCIRTN